MEKVVHLLRTRPSADRAALGAALAGAVAGLVDLGCSDVAVHVADDTVGIAGPMPCGDGELPLRAAVSAWVPAHDLVAPAEVLAELERRFGLSGLEEKTRRGATP